jgi:asparagine synthase (glutamine-hydrolysing)
MGPDREIDPRAVDCLLTLEYIPAPLSIYRGVRRETVRWPDPVPSDMDIAPSAARLRQLLRESVADCLEGDEPPGVWLSGGLDSSAIVAMMADLGTDSIRTFSVGFEEESYDELRYARIVADRFGTEHAEYVMEPPAPDLVRRALKCLREPLADLGFLSTFVAAERASNRVKTVLSGEGADELLGGYDCHVAAKLDRVYRILPGWVRRSLVPGLLGAFALTRKKRGLINTAVRFAAGAALPARAGHLRWRMHLDDGARDALYADGLRSRLDGWDPLTDADGSRLSHDDFEGALRADLESYLPGSMLAKAKSAALAHSLEVRFPFLQEPLVAFARGLPADMKLKGFSRKHVLKEAMKGILPSAILNRRKEGFSVPMKHWLRGSLKPLLTEVLSEERVGERGLFRPAAVTKLVEQHLAGTHNHSHILWAMIVLDLFLSRSQST